MKSKKGKLLTRRLRAKTKTVMLLPEYVMYSEMFERESIFLIGVPEYVQTYVTGISRKRVHVVNEYEI